METAIYYLAAIVAVIFVLVPHEYAHAYAAFKCGDPTANVMGRMTLNPLRHLDPYGFVLCILTGFGWAKPVPINPGNFRHFRRGLFITAIAGVVVNYLIAFIAYALLLLVRIYFPVDGGLYYVYYFLYLTLQNIFVFSISVFIFNLLPFDPLDGFRVVEALTRQINPVNRFLKTYGRYILIILVLESFLCDVLQSYANISFAKYFDLLGYVRWFAFNILAYPIRIIWNSIFGLGLPGLSPLGVIYIYG